jgi:hypothetical protein
MWQCGGAVGTSDVVIRCPLIMAVCRVSAGTVLVPAPVWRSNRVAGAARGERPGSVRGASGCLQRRSCLPGGVRVGGGGQRPSLPGVEVTVSGQQLIGAQPRVEPVSQGLFTHRARAELGGDERVRAAFVQRDNPRLGKRRPSGPTRRTPLPVGTCHDASQRPHARHRDVGRIPRPVRHRAANQPAPRRRLRRT